MNNSSILYTDMSEAHDLTIVIQAGGQSSRMGQDKALMPFLGQPLIERQVARLRGLGAALLVVSNHPEQYAFLHLPMVSDHYPGAGPLGGLLTALEAVGTLQAAVVACDMPFLQARLIQAQSDLLQQEGADAVIPRSQEGPEPLHGVYRVATCLPAVRAAFEAGERKMIAWYPAVRVREMTMDEVAVWDPEFISFMNVNKPEEFQQAEQLALRLEGE